MKTPLNFRLEGRERPGISAPTTAWVGHMSLPPLAPSRPLYTADALSYKNAVSGRSLHRQSLKHCLSWCNTAKILPFTEAPFHLYVLTFPSLSVFFFFFQVTAARRRQLLLQEGVHQGRGAAAALYIPPSPFPASSHPGSPLWSITPSGVEDVQTSLTPPMSFPYPLLHKFIYWA